MKSEAERVFPEVPNAGAFFDRFGDEAHWRPGAEALREEIGLSHLPMERVLRGSNLVYQLGDGLILKCYPPPFRDDGEVELAILDAISPQAERLLAPRLEGTGERDGWLYMVQTRMRGEILTAEHWCGFAPRDRKRLAERLGEWAADFAQSGAQRITLPGGRADWQELQRTQRERVAEQLYDALAPLVYLGRGEREVVEVVRDAWGVSDESPEELMRWILLHRFSHLPHYLTWPHLRDCETLNEMAAVFATGT